MKRQEREFFRDLLTTWLEELCDRADAAVAEFKNTDITAADPLEKAALDYDQSLAIRMRDRESRLIHRIRESIAKLEDGTYGICDLCEEEIAIERMMARPIANLCITCKTQLEAIERLASKAGRSYAVAETAS